MNTVVLMGRLTRNPDIRWTQGQDQTCVARFTLAVNRRFTRDGEQNADFISCVAFGRQAEFMEKYTHQGTKLVVRGRIQTGSYTNREGHKVYTTDVVTEEVEFAESKAASERAGTGTQPNPAPAPEPEPRQMAMDADPDGFMTIPEGIEEELPFI